MRFKPPSSPGDRAVVTFATIEASTRRRRTAATATAAALVGAIALLPLLPQPSSRPTDPARAPESVAGALDAAPAVAGSLPSSPPSTPDREPVRADRPLPLLELDLVRRRIAVRAALRTPSTPVDRGELGPS